MKALQLVFALIIIILAILIYQKHKELRLSYEKLEALNAEYENMKAKKEKVEYITNYVTRPPATEEPNPDWITPKLPPITGKTKPVLKMKHEKKDINVSVKKTGLFPSEVSNR